MLFAHFKGLYRTYSIFWKNSNLRLSGLAKNAKGDLVKLNARQRK
jgi:hypothetical protein